MLTHGPGTGFEVHSLHFWLYYSPGMDPGVRAGGAEHIISNEGRPYRSHMQPACLPCRARKSRCQTGATTSTCAMCQAHGTECVFPQVAERRQITPGQSRRSTPLSGRQTPSAASRMQHSPRVSRTRRPSSISPTVSHRVLPAYTIPLCAPFALVQDVMVNRPDRPTPPTSQQDESMSAMMGIIAQPDEGTSHVVSPAIADDDRVFQDYLSNTSTAQKRRMVKFHLNLGQPTRHSRQILFNIVPKRGERETESRSIAASSCEVIEKLIDPYQDDLITLWVSCVPRE